MTKDIVLAPVLFACVLVAAAARRKGAAAHDRHDLLVRPRSMGARPRREHTMRSRVLSAALAAVAGVLAIDPVGAASHNATRRAAGYRVEDIAANTPAARAGIRRGDRIMAIDGAPISNGEDLDRAMERSGRAVIVRVERAGRHLRLRIAPRAVTRAEADEYVAPHRRVLGIVRTEWRLRPGTGANDIYVPPPIPIEPQIPSIPIVVN